MTEEINPHSAWSGETPPANKDRIWAAYSSRRWGRVLELGPHDGRDTIHLAKHCEKLSAVEGRGENVVATQAACDRAGAYNVTLFMGDLEKFDLARLGRFDSVWAVGILYHLPRPWDLVARIAEMTDLVYGWSHCASQAAETRDGCEGDVWIEGGPDEPLSGLSPQSFWLTPAAFERMWYRHRYHGFQWLKGPSPHPNGGLAGQFVAQREGIL
jgi:hypothetical protein